MNGLGMSLDQYRYAIAWLYKRDCPQEKSYAWKKTACLISAAIAGFDPFNWKHRGLGMYASVFVDLGSLILRIQALFDVLCLFKIQCVYSIDRSVIPHPKPKISRSCIASFSNLYPYMGDFDTRRYNRMNPRTCYVLILIESSDEIR